MKQRKENKTKKTLLSSIIVLIICIAMFLGTTFAWFSDSVSNTGNRIQAGTLQIRLLMDKQLNGNYVDISNGSGDIFNIAENANNSNKTLWEPGKTQWVALAVQNKGNLAAKYNIILDVVDEGLLNTINDESVLEYAILDGAKAADLQGAEKWTDITSAEGVQKGTVVAGRVLAAPSGRLAAAGDSAGKDFNYFVLAVHMKEDAGNEYQDMAALIDVNIVATQWDHEFDGFDNSNYDIFASVPTVAERIDGYGTKDSTRDNNGTAAAQMEVTIRKVEQSSGEIVLGTIGNATVPAAAVDGLLTDFLGTLPSKVEGITIKDDLLLTLTVETKTATSSAMKIGVSMAGVATRTEIAETEEKVIEIEEKDITELKEAVTVVINLPVGLLDVSVDHTHGDVTTPMQEAQSLESLQNGQFYYNKTTGELSLKTDKFSDFDIFYTIPHIALIGDTGYASIQAAVDAYRTGYVIRAVQDIPEGTIYSDKTDTITIDLNGKTVKAYAGAKINIVGDGVVELVVPAEKKATFVGGSIDSLELQADSTTSIQGGSYEKLVVPEEAHLTVSGGQFKIDVNEYCDDDHYCYRDPSSDWYYVIPYEDPQSDYIVKVICGDTYTYEKSFSAALDNTEKYPKIDKLVLLKDHKESFTIHGFDKNKLIIDLNNHTLTANDGSQMLLKAPSSSASLTSDFGITIYECDSVSITNGSIKAMNAPIRIGEHQYTIVKWANRNNGQYEAAWGYHPLYPATNVHLIGLNLTATNGNAVVFTNIDGAGVVYPDVNEPTVADPNLYGHYIYKTGYETKEQWIDHRMSEVFTALELKDSVVIQGGSYTSTKEVFGKTTANITSDMLIINSGTFNKPDAGRFVSENTYYLVSQDGSCTTTNTIPKTYTASLGRMYYIYAGGANDAITFANSGDTVYINENATVERVLGLDQSLTIVSLAEGVSWTGAKASTGYEIVATPDSQDARIVTYASRPNVEARLYYTSDSRHPEYITESTEYKDYGTLAEAFKDAQRYQIIKLMKDITLEKTGTFTHSSKLKKTDYGITYSNGCGFDLNGHVITYTGNGVAILCTTKSGSSGAETVIMDSSNPSTGKIIATNGDCLGKAYKNTEYFSIRGGTYISEKSYALWVADCNNLTIYSGTFQGKDYWIGKSNVTTFDIQGGTFIPSQDAQTTADSESPGGSGKSSGGGGGPCVAAGTMITLADGTLKAVEDIELGDIVKTYSFADGSIAVQPVVAYEESVSTNVDEIVLNLDNGSSLTMIVSQAVFDMDAREYVVVDSANAQSMVGHRIMVLGQNGIKSAAVVSAEVTEKTQMCYEVLTAYDMNFFANGIMTCEPYLLCKNIYAIDENYAYDKTLMAQDIAQYGLFGYETFADYVSEEEFEYYGLANLKVAIGKGILTEDEMFAAIELYNDCCVQADQVTTEESAAESLWKMILKFFGLQ